MIHQFSAEENARAAFGVCSSMETCGVMANSPDLLAALEWAHCTPQYAQYLVRYVVPKIGFCVGDLFSDLRPEEFAERYLGISLRERLYGIFSDTKAASYKEALCLSMYLRGIPPDIPNLFRLEEADQQKLKEAWPGFLAEWQEAFVSRYGRTVPEVRAEWQALPLGI